LEHHGDTGSEKLEHKNAVWNIFDFRDTLISGFHRVRMQLINWNFNVCFEPTISVRIARICGKKWYL